MWRDPILILRMRVGIYSYCPLQSKLIAYDNAVKIWKVPKNVGNNNIIL